VNPTYETMLTSLSGKPPLSPVPGGVQYSYAVKPGGVDYYRNGQPVTREIYAAGTGADVGSIEKGATAASGSVLGSAKAPTNPNGASAAAAPAYQDKSNDIALQNAGLGTVDTQTTAGLKAIEDALAHLTGQYDTETTANEGLYGKQSDDNQNSLQRNKQTAMVNAAQGRKGLFGELSSLGALNGSGIELANHAVQNGANEDLAGAGDTYASNQSELDTAIGKYREQDKERRDNAATAATNAKTNAKGAGAKSKQQFYSNLANDYAAEGNSGEAKRYTDLASSLFPDIAQANIPDSNIAYTGAAFTPGSLSNYLVGGNSTQVSATPATGGGNGPGGLPGLVAGNNKRKLQPA
jgi:hypothetical protein